MNQPKNTKKLKIINNMLDKILFLRPNPNKKRERMMEMFK